MKDIDNPEILAHDLNNVLAAIRLNLDWLESRKPASGEAEALSDMKAACKRGMDLVERLRRLAESGSGEKVP